MDDIRAELAKRCPRSKEVFERSRKVLAEEVVGTVQMPFPFYIRQARGSRVIDVDGNEYIDLAMGFGPHVLGHAPDVVIDAVKEAADRGLHWGLHNPYQEPLARLLVEAAPCAEQVVFCNSGSEATGHAIRAARAYTGKTKVGLFEGSYHGAHDYVLVDYHKKSPPDRPRVAPRCAGIPRGTLNQIIMLPYRNEAACDIIRKHRDELAVVMIEPVQSSNPRLDCGDFIRAVREVCRECDVLFLMDEVITGFRLAYGGGQELFDVVPDLATYGKVLGGGMPIGAIAGPSRIMKVFASRVDGEAASERILCGGTFSGNPMTMATGHAAVGYLREHPESYTYLREQGDRLADGINRFCAEEEIPAQMMSAFSMFHLRFQRSAIHSARDLDPTLSREQQTFYLHLLSHGVVVPGIHLAFISTAHSPEDIDQVIDAFRQSFLEVKERGLV